MTAGASFVIIVVVCLFAIMALVGSTYIPRDE